MTYNIHNFMSNQQRDELIAHLKAFKHPTRANVIMDDPDLVRRFRREFPKAITIYRKYFPGEFGDNNSQEKIDANGWANVYQTEMPASEGAYWYCNNEAALTDKNAAFLEACARRTIELGGRGVFGNFSVGTPEKDDWRKLNGLLRLMAQYPDRLILAVHEYFPTLWTVGVSGTTPHPSQWPAKINGAGDLVARYRRLFEHCDAEGIERPKLIITESSSDRVHDVGIWQQSLKRAGHCDISGPWFCNVPQWQEWGQAAGMTWEQYAFAQLQAVWNAVYRHDPNVIDWCHFCWGADPGSAWRGFDLMHMPPSFRQSMEQGNWSMATQPPPSNLAWPVTLSWGVPMKFRPSPTTGIAHTAVIPANTPIALQSTEVITSEPIEKDGKIVTPAYVWMHVRYGGKAGYVALGTTP